MNRFYFTLPDNRIGVILSVSAPKGLESKNSGIPDVIEFKRFMYDNEHGSEVGIFGGGQIIPLDDNILSYSITQGNNIPNSLDLIIIGASRQKSLERVLGSIKM